MHKIRGRNGRRERLRVLALALFLLFWATSGWAEPFKLGENWELSLYNRTRVEFWNWFETRSSVPSSQDNNDYTFFANQLRVGLAYQRDWLKGFFELQNTALVSLPSDAVAPAPQAALGAGAVYFTHNRRGDDASVFPKQAYLTMNLKPLGLPGLSLTGGRFEFAEGLEALTGDPTLDWLKRVRVAERLIGPFGWSHVGRSFDGGRLSYDTPNLNFTFMGSHPTQGGFDLNGLDEMSKVDLLYGAVTLKKSAWLPFGDARLFYIYYGDGRNVTKIDNRSAGARAADRQDISFSTWGAHFVAAKDLGPGKADLLLWGALQDGEWGTLDQEAWAWAVETGYQFPNVAWKPWLRLGAFGSSGDDNTADGDHETFYQILPTARLYSLSTFYNLMNNKDYFLQLILRPMPGLLWRTDLHWIRLAEGKDLWYQGAGATLRKRLFGFTGRSGLRQHDLMKMLETALSYDITPNINANLYYGHSFGGDLVKRIFGNRSGDYGYVELVLKF